MSARLTAFRLLIQNVAKRNQRRAMCYTMGKMRPNA